MSKDKDIDLFKTLLDETTELFPYRYFVTTGWSDYSILNRLGKSIDYISFNDKKIIAQKNKAHLYCITGVNDDTKRKLHFHSIVLASSELNFDILEHKFMDGRDTQVQPYDNRRNGLVYIIKKHIPYIHENVVHPRIGRVGCRSHGCKFSNVLKPYIPRFETRKI